MNNLDWLPKPQITAFDAMAMMGQRIEVTSLLGKKWVDDKSRPRRTHRRTRIQKKLIKRFGYHQKQVDMDPFRVGNVLYMSGDQFEAMKKRLEQK